MSDIYTKSAAGKISKDGDTITTMGQNDRLKKILPKIPHPKQECYKMDHEQRGFAYIFNHIQDGIDKNRITQTLIALGFEVQVYENLDFNDIVNVLATVSTMNYCDVDCCVVVVITHGDMNTLEAGDKSYYPELIWMPFTGDRCPSLMGKPKLFFIDACRGKYSDRGVEIELDGNREQEQQQADSTINIPTMADFLIMFSTQPGYLGYADKTKGSWFIDALCTELEGRALNEDLLSILTCVNRKVALEYEGKNSRNPELHGTKQVSSVVSTLTRDMYFKKSS